VAILDSAAWFVVSDWSRNVPVDGAEPIVQQPEGPRRPSVTSASWNQVTTLLLRIQACDTLGRSGGGAPVGLLPEPDSLPRAANVRTRIAKGNSVSSDCLYDSPDRVHNDLWLVDRHHVTGLLSDHQASSF
jgi:hypothetical protein